MSEAPPQPPRPLGHAHAQSLFATVGPRRWRAWRDSRPLHNASRALLLESPDGVRLQGWYTPAPDDAIEPAPLVVLLHGWEGSAQSPYLLAAAVRLHDAGHAVARLNFRDHGPTHHLNRRLFNSTRLTEVDSAIEQIARYHGTRRVALIGFSLGGNFALRLAADHNGPLVIDPAIAVCPVISPRHTIEALHHGPRLYHDYFTRKWRRSLIRKLRYFPDLGYDPAFLRGKGLKALNAYFVPAHTDYATPDQYLDAYAISGNRLRSLKHRAHIIASRDDPVIPPTHLNWMATPPGLTREILDWGGHCGFITNWRGDSWLDERLVQLLTTTYSTA